MRLGYIFIFCFTFISLYGYGQNPKADSILNVIPTLNNDSTKVNSLIKLGTAYLSTDVNAALKYGSEALELATTLNYANGEGYSHKLLGQALSNQSKYLEALVEFEASLAVFES